MTAVTIDTNRARLVVSLLQNAYDKRDGLLSELDDLVENQIPADVKPQSKEHALFLFYIVANDHGMKSARLYKQAKALFANEPQLFDPYKVQSIFEGPEDKELIERTGNYLGTRYPKETAKAWYLNSVRLVEKYQGDPRTLLKSTRDARMLIKEIKSFRGYGPKIGGMFLRAAIGLGFADVENLEEVLVPVDIHDSRISFLTSILKIEGENPPDVTGEFDYYKYVLQVQKVLLDACNASKIKWLDVDRALWIIGSRGCVTKRCELCPLNQLCVVGQKVMNGRLPLF